LKQKKYQESTPGRNINYHTIIAMMVVIVLFLPAIITAQTATDPKGDIPAPPGTNSFLYYFRHLSANEYYINGHLTGSAIAGKDYDLSADISLFRFCHFFETNHVPWSLNVIVPYSRQQLKRGEGTSQIFNETSSGFGDSVVSGGIWFLKNPKYYADFVVLVTVPTGEYSNSKAVNVGCNRWAYRPEIGIVLLPFDKWTFELHGFSEFYTPNTDYGISHATLKKNLQYNVTSHLSYDVNKSLFFSTTYYWNRGGETEINGVKQQDDIATQGIMFTTSVKLFPKVQLLVQYQRDVSVRCGLLSTGIRTRLAYFF
jgi:hypothetical protein